MTDEKETTDLEAAILAVEDEDAAAEAESLDDGVEVADDAASDGDAPAAAAPTAEVPDWVAEFERTGNPHVIADPVLRARALKLEQKYTDKFERVARLADRVKELGAVKPEPAPQVQEDSGPPSLGDDIDPEFTKAVDARAAWIVNKRLEALGLDKLPEQFQTTVQTQQERDAQAYADGIMNDLRTTHGLSDDDIAYASQVMAPENPAIAGLLKTPKGREHFAKLVRLERGTTAAAEKDIKDKAAAAAAATLRPSGGVRGSKPVKDYAKMSRAEIEAEIAAESKRLGIE